jgi:hypothetical protein
MIYEEIAPHRYALHSEVVYPTEEAAKAYIAGLRPPRPYFVETLAEPPKTLVDPVPAEKKAH